MFNQLGEYITEKIREHFGLDKKTRFFKKLNILDTGCGEV